MQKFSSFGRKKKTENRPKFDIEWLCSKVFNCKIVALTSALLNILLNNAVLCWPICIVLN